MGSKGQAGKATVSETTPFCCVDTSTRALHHLSLISEELNVMYSVERLPADSRRQIKSLTLESKALSLSLDKHERSGGDGLRVPSASRL